MEIKNLSDLAFIDISGVDKKINDNEQKVFLCNFTDIYNNWAVSKDNIDSFMIASANNNEIKRFLLKRGSVAITKDSETRDDIGMSCYIADNLDNTLLGYHCALIIPNESVLNGKYLNAFLNGKTARIYFSNQASGSGQRYTLTIGGIGAVKIPIISLYKQEKIGNLFSFIDRKIINNNKINAELESMAKTLYDYWFLQFEFPNEEGKPYKSSGGKMVYNDQLKKEIPEGWQVKKVCELLNVVTGKEDANFAVENGQYPFFTCANDISYCNISKFSGKAVLIAGNGDFNVKYYDGKFNAYQRTYVLIPNDDKYVGLVYQNCFRIIKQFKSGSAGSIVKFITKGDVDNIQILIPQNENIINIFNILLNKKQQLERENQELTALRDFLLPMLMNGQVTFKDENEETETTAQQAKNISAYLQRFNAWKQQQGFAARGDVDDETLKKIFDAMDEDDKK